MDKLMLPFAGEIEVREEEDVRTISGYAFKWNAEGRLIEGSSKYKEQILNGSISKRALSDVGLNTRHYAPYIARTKSGDMKAWTDDKGLRWEAQMDMEDPDHAVLYKRVKKGLYDGSSVEMYIANGGVTRSFESDGSVIATITKIRKVRGITVAQNPVYKSSTVEARELRDFFEQDRPDRSGPSRPKRTDAVRALAYSRR